MSEGPSPLDNARIEHAKQGYLRFIETCRQGSEHFSLTAGAESTAYARCFAVFGLHLLRQLDTLGNSHNQIIRALRSSIRAARHKSVDIPVDKPYRQLLTFTLSALAILDALDEDPLADLVTEQLPSDVNDCLTEAGALAGRPQSGNQAMFLAIFLLHARDRLGLQVQADIDRWVELHLTSMDRFGFWGNDAGMRHLAFQNGYHQYEILEFLEIGGTWQRKAVSSVRSLADDLGHFAPYPGGGGCYDYDAVFVLTPDGKVPDAQTGALLLRTAETLLNEQRPEGGWGESLYVRPRGLRQLTGFATHLWEARARRELFRERLRYALALQRPRHDRIHTHWSRYSRHWNEADLWDSWFRLLTLARIQVALEPQRVDDWGFIDYPGIGYHPALSSRTKP